MVGYISIKQILDDCLDHPLLQDLSLERAVNYAVQFIQKVGMPQQFIEKTEVLTIDNYRAQLPCDFYEIIQVRAIDDKNGEYSMLIYSTDSFHMSQYQTDDTLTYKLQNNCIFTSIKEGNIEIAYRAIPIDNDGFPLIPDNTFFIEALELYIKKKHFTMLFDLGKINQASLQNVQQEYAWVVGQAQSDLVRPSLDQMQAITNSWNTLVQRSTSHSSGFKYNNQQELIKLQ